HETNEDKPLLQEVPILKTEEMSETKTEGTPETKNKDIVTKTQEEIPVSNPPVEQEGENLNPKEEPIKEQPQYEVQKNWICGDLNQNGKLDVGDPVLLMRNLQKKQSVTPELGDVNTDGKVDFLDVHTLARQMVES
ncbi:MAG: dockerin type I domain-containing protein, partial [Planctomycetota bacterium]